MKRCLVLLAILCAGVFPAAASADTPYDFASGAGDIQQWNAHASAHFAFTAHNGPTGTTGQMELKFTYDDNTPTEQYTADVTCLTVVGNRAALTGTITRVMNPTSSLQEGDALNFTVQDDGPPGAGFPDLFDATGGTSNCVVPVLFPAQPIDMGNIKVN
jgi:hypothetical protein